MKALATEGIQRGHMSLHAKNVAAMAGVPQDMADAVIQQMVEEKAVRIDRAKEIMEELEGKTK